MKKVIGVISYDDNDFKSQVEFIVVHDYYIINRSKRSIETEDTVYYCISNSLAVHSMSFDSVIFTQKAIFNKELISIINAVRPTIIQAIRLRDIFKEQLEKSQPISEELLGKLENKAYYNGEPIKVGDIVLYGFLEEGEEIIIKNIPTKSLVLIAINENHFDGYNYVRHIFDQQNSDYTSIIPVIKLKI